MIAIGATSQNWYNQQWIGLVIPIPKKEKENQNFGHSQGRFYILSI
jgi:hypothetical protein